MTKPFNWHQQVLNPKGMATIMHQAKQHFGLGALAEEAVTYVLEQLAKDNWQRCRKYEGRSGPTAYLAIVTRNLLREFARKRCGRLRPPQKIVRKGKLWQDVWRRYPVEQQRALGIVNMANEDKPRRL